MGKGHVDQFPPPRDLAVHFVRDTYRTCLNARAASRTFLRVDKSGLLYKFDIETTFSLLDLSDFRIGEDFNVGMIIDLIHLRGFYAYGTVICGEGLV